MNLPKVTNDPTKLQWKERPSEKKPYHSWFPSSSRGKLSMWVSHRHGVKQFHRCHGPLLLLPPSNQVSFNSHDIILAPCHSGTPFTINTISFFQSSCFRSSKFVFFLVFFPLCFNPTSLLDQAATPPALPINQFFFGCGDLCYILLLAFPTNHHHMPQQPSLLMELLQQIPNFILLFS